ncbi:MAG: dipeptidase [Vulcanimicrobiota bacterium]
MIPILLGHNDTLLRLHRQDDHISFLEGDDQAHLDLPRARQAGVAGGFFACWVPRYLEAADPDEVVWPTEWGYETSLADPLDPEHAREQTLAMMEKLFLLEQDSGGELALVRNLEDLSDCLKEGRFASILHFEGAEAIAADLSNLEDFYSAGLRSLGLVWSRPNLFGHGVPFCFPCSPDTGPGLTRAGRELVQVCNELGIMLDVSHLNEQGFWDLARLTRAPLVATHSNAQGPCPSSRNLTDEQLRAIADSGGLVGINFCTSDLRPDGQDDADTPIDLVYQQIEYVVEEIGLEHVALGTDFDGAIVPAELSDVSALGELMEGLQERGMDRNDLEQVGFGNWLRVLADTW